MNLYEILVPTEMDRDVVGGENTRPIRVRQHRVFDEKVKSISGGISILPVLKGTWIDNTGSEYKERMIPVRIACTHSQITEIAEWALKFYNQKAVMYYKISNECYFVESECEANKSDESNTLQETYSNYEPNDDYEYEYDEVERAHHEIAHGVDAMLGTETLLIDAMGGNPWGI